MAKTYTYSWAIGQWAERTRLSYAPIDIALDDRSIREIFNKTPYKVEDTETGVIYMTYSSGPEEAAIIKITEA